MTKKPIKRVVLRASNPSPRATNLEGYTKFTIPWNDGTGENLYVWIKPDESSQTVYIGSDENLKIQTRQKNLVFKTNTAGVVSAYQSQATLEVIQTNAVYNYRLILSSTSTSVHAAGAELPLTAQLEAKIGDEIIYTKAVEATFTLEDSEGFTLQGSTLSVANRGTYIGNQRSCIVSAVVNAPETGEEVFGNLQINQEGNYIEDVEWEGGSFSYDGIGAGATSATPKVTEMTPRFHYTSGQSSAVVPSSTYGTWEVPAVAYSLAKSQNGFTAVNTDTGVLTATHRGTTIGNARASAIVSRLKSGTWTPSANFNAKGSKTAEDTLTATCTQAKNVPTAITSVPTFSYAAGALAPYGGTKNVSVSGKVTITWSSGSTSEESTSGTKTGFSVQGTRTYSMVAATGFSINSSTGAVTAATMGTTLGSRSSGNVTSTLKWVLTINDTYGGGELTDSKSSTLTTPVTQGVNKRTQVFAKPNILTFTAVDIPASGGSVSSGTITYKQLSTWDYTSGATSTGPEYTTGGTVKYSTAVSASSLATTVKSRTRIGTLTATVTMNGKSGSASKDVYQAANSATYGNVTITGGSVSVIPASGGSVSSASGISASQTVSFTSGATRAGSVSISYSTAVSASSKGTTISNQTTAGTLTATATGEGSKKATKQFTVYQAKNVPTALTSDAAFSYPSGDIPAGGGTKAVTTEGSCKVTYSSGSSETRPSSGSYTGYTLTFSRTWSMTSASGFSINSSNGTITASDRGTTTGNRRTSGNVSSTLSWTLTISSTYGGGTLSAQDSPTVNTPVGQQANTATYGDVSLTANNPYAQVANTGGSATISASASQTISFTSGSTRAGEVSITYTQKAAVSGFSLSGNKVTVSANQTTSARSYVVVVKASGEGSKSASKEVTVSQAAGVRTYSGITLNVSYPVIPASGGTSTPSISYSQTWGWNGATTGGGTVTSGGTLTYSGTSVSTSNGAVSAGSKGKTVSEVTTVTTATVKVSLNGKSGSKTATVYQAANDYVLHWDGLVASGTESGIDAAGSNTFYPVKAVVKSGYSLTNAVEFSSGETLTANADISDFLQQHLTVTASNLPSWATVYETNPYLFVFIIIRVVIAANTGSARSATCTFRMYSDNGSYDSSVTLTLSQNAANHLDVSPTSLSFTASGGTKSISIDTNESWTIS